MFQRILVLILLMMVEFSTIRECFSDCKYKVEAQDIEDNNESEDIVKEIELEKYIFESPYFQFSSSHNLSENIVCDDISSIIINPYQDIASPPPKG